VTAYLYVIGADTGPLKIGYSRVTAGRRVTAGHDSNQSVMMTDTRNVAGDSQGSLRPRV